MTRPPSRSAQNTSPPEEPGFLARMALAMIDWTERRAPDAFGFALGATLIVVVAGVAFTPSSIMWRESDPLAGKSAAPSKRHPYFA